MDYRQFITTALESAARIAREQFGTVATQEKGIDNNQVLTETDLAVGKLLVEQISDTFPTHNIIDEEAGVIDRGGTITWVVDPIDGTSNFASGVPLYGIMLGVLDGETPIAGGIALPSFQQVIVAEKGRGCFCNDEQISVTSQNMLSKCLIAYGIDGHQEKPEITHEEVKTVGEIVLAIRNLRSSNSAYDLAQVALGKYGGMLNRTSKIWDNVAQHSIIEEAGGIYTDFFGQSMNYADALNRIEENFTFCAAPPELHRQLQGIIHR